MPWPEERRNWAAAGNQPNPVGAPRTVVLLAAGPGHGATELVSSEFLSRLNLVQRGEFLCAALSLDARRRASKTFTINPVRVNSPPFVRRA